MTTKHKTVRQPIADKVLKRLQKELKSKVIDLSIVRQGKAQAADLQKTVATDELAKLPPSYAAYAWTQNQISITAEQLLLLKPLRRFEEIIKESDEMYTALGPPMSPLTPSFHSGWSQFDLSIGLGKESLATIVNAVNRRLGAHESFIDLTNKLGDSYCSIHQVIDSDDQYVRLRELWTNAEVVARNVSGYLGKKGELWYARVLPPNDLEPGIHIVFNTPYVMYETTVKGWSDYFDRALDSSTQDSRKKDFQSHMKYGNNPFYWTEYVFESYVNHTDSFILSKGLPDLPQSLPHSGHYQQQLTW